MNDNSSKSCVNTPVLSKTYYLNNSLFRASHNNFDKQLSLEEICVQISQLKYIPERIDLLMKQGLYHIQDPKFQILFKVVKTNSEVEMLNKMLHDNNVQK